MKRLSKSDIRINDYKYVEMLDDYSLMTDNGHKKEYIVAVLREKYNVSESTLRRVLKRLLGRSQDVKGEQQEIICTAVPGRVNLCQLQCAVKK